MEILSTRQKFVGFVGSFRVFWAIIFRVRENTSPKTSSSESRLRASWQRNWVLTSALLFKTQSQRPYVMSRKLPVWELRLVPHEVSLGLWGRVWGGWGGWCQFWTVFAAVGFWVFFGQDSRSPFWVSFGRFSGAFQEVHEGFWGRFWAFQEAHEGTWGLFWACLELIVGRRWMALREADAACRLFSIKRIHGACGGQIMRPCPS